MALLDQNGVPILALSEESRRAVADAHETGILLTGELVLLHNGLPIHPPPGGGPDVAVFHIGAETLDEAAKSVIGAFDSAFGHRAPRKLASTHEQLARVLAEHYQARIAAVEELIP